MEFTVLPSRTQAPTQGKSCAYLLTDEWDDWFEFSTLYSLVLFNHDGERHIIGGVKIGEFGMGKNQRRPEIPEEFNRLEDKFFSLGQDDSYYERLNLTGPEIRKVVLTALRDVALDLDLFQRARKEKVTGTSLLRSVLPRTVISQFNRMANGGLRVSRYSFRYTAPKPRQERVSPLTLDFSVEPESNPPTNIHVLIGRNGVGKTITLNNIARAIVDLNSAASKVGELSTEMETQDTQDMFTNLVSVTFSAFDPFEPLPSRRDKSKGIHYAYIGLKHVGKMDDGNPLPPKTPDQLSRDFGNSVKECRQGARLERWRRALKMLETDSIFNDAGVADLASESLGGEEVKDKGRKIFAKLSSGHKIVLLSITRLVETVGEKTLVLVDEPEAHLHPPLLSAFVRAISDLLINRNGVAVIATHSPVILQEVPRNCVWKIRRTGEHVVAERPDIETFGENVGILTREVFGLEVTHSGFHKMLLNAIDEGRDFENVVQMFSNELGGEARAIVQALIAARNEDSDVDL